MKRSLIAAGVALVLVLFAWLGWKSWTPAPPAVVFPETEASAPAPVQPGAPRAENPLPGAVRISAASAAQLQLLNEVLANRDDNDPRLDQSFRRLSPEAKQVFRDRYRQLPLEKRNERGTVVYLLGQNIQEPADFAFFREVLAEAPCLSMSDCSKEMKTEDAHLEGGIETSLAYPQIVSLKQMERILESARGGGQIEALATIRMAKNARMTLVAKMAAEMEQRFGQ